MKAKAWIVLAALLSTSALADVEVVRKGTQPGVDDSVLVAQYDHQIDQLNQVSDQISAQIFSKKSGVQNEQAPARDGMTVTLIKVK